MVLNIYVITFLDNGWYLGTDPLIKFWELLKFSKEHAPHSQYIISNILKMYVFYVLLGEEIVIA
jgi:hypothetical protein